jgi:hypothetical protein
VSTSYTPDPLISAAELLGGRLKRYGIVEHWAKWIAVEEHQRHRMLTDGENYVHVSIDNDGIVRCFERFAPNGSPGYMLDCIRCEFGVAMMDDSWEPPYGDAEPEPAPANEDERLAEQKLLSFAVLRAATKLGMTEEDIICHVQGTFQEWEAHGGQLPEDYED